MKPIETLSNDEVHSLLVALQKDPTWSNHPKKTTRNHLMASLMVDAGLRNAEVAQLPTLSLLNADRPPYVLVLPGAITKTKLPRAIPLTNRLKDAIGAYLIYYDPDPHQLPPPFAFPNYIPPGHLSTRQIHRIIANASGRSIGRRIHPHVLRHTFATNLMRTSNSRIVQELLGHKRLTSTQVYTHPNVADLRIAIDSLDPSRPVKPPVKFGPDVVTFADNIDNT